MKTKEKKYNYKVTDPDDNPASARMAKKYYMMRQMLTSLAGMDKGAVKKTRGKEKRDNKKEYRNDKKGETIQNGGPQRIYHFFSHP